MYCAEDIGILLILGKNKIEENKWLLKMQFCCEESLLLKIFLNILPERRSYAAFGTWQFAQSYIYHWFLLTQFYEMLSEDNAMIPRA